ncbi:MAG: hypothetical protein CMP10_00360 [Zetaproteobacteria bacterium]|jgi:chromosome segregation ATPase|nr:hypothetical protein [Pseudobdellovibrionaceae bacterium]|tara:strand:- start:472 stop:708 length:237 start_codon:yes stop_codon:yes gene_type:complete
MSRPNNVQKINRNQVSKIRAREAVVRERIKTLMGKEAKLANKLNAVQEEIEQLRDEGAFMTNLKQKLLKKLKNNNNNK